jgi:uncharacterized coiled-coil DUF342 family protein
MAVETRKRIKEKIQQCHNHANIIGNNLAEIAGQIDKHHTQLAMSVYFLMDILSKWTDELTRFDNQI